MKLLIITQTLKINQNIGDKNYSQQVKNNILLNNKQNWENIQNLKLLIMKI